jgi:hypothetical protein
LKPWEFRVHTQDQKAELVAAFIVDREIEGYYASELNKKRNSDELKRQPKHR